VPNDQDQAAGTGKRNHRRPTLPPLACIFWFCDFLPGIRGKPIIREFKQTLALDKCGRCKFSDSVTVKWNAIATLKLLKLKVGSGQFQEFVIGMTGIVNHCVPGCG
jgi:hypothetical protein